MQMTEEPVKARLDIMEPREVSAYLGVSSRTLFRFVHRLENPIPHIRLGKRVYRFDREKVDRWVMRQEVK